MREGDNGLSLASTGLRGEFDEKGPAVEVEVTGDDSVSEVFSLGRLSLRRRLSTRALLERL